MIEHGDNNLRAVKVVDSSDGQRLRLNSQTGMSLIEIIIVVSLVALVYAMAAPDLLMGKEAEVKQRVNRLAEDIRSAYDIAVLTGKYQRIVFDMRSGDYWLETTDSERVVMGSQELDRDPVQADEQEVEAQFNERFKEYETLAGSEVQDPSDESVIKPTSPILQAKSALQGVKWTKVQSGEWDTRNLGPELVIQGMQTEHHRAQQTAETVGEGGVCVLYFFPEGYVEKAVIYLNEAEYSGDNKRPPYSIITEPYEGMAEIFPEYKEVDVSRDAQKKS
jgi:general secretion pathway protein H